MRKTNPMVFVTSFLFLAFVLVVVVLSFSMIYKKPLNTISYISISNIVPDIFLVVTSGTPGDERGWRGYAWLQSR